MVLIAQLSDTHIAADENGIADMSSEPARALRTAVRSVLALPTRPDCVVVTGDLTERGLPPEYAVLRELLAPLPIPVHLLPGNHDDRSALRDAFPRSLGSPGAGDAAGSYGSGSADSASAADGVDRGGRPHNGGPDDAGSPHRAAYGGEPGAAPPVQYAVRVGATARLVCCDTTIPGRPHGTLDQERLDWLDAVLAAEPQAPTVVALHHPPFPIGVRFVDDMGFTAPERLATVIRGHPQVVRIVSGHVHRGAVSSFAGTVAVSCPSTYQQLYLDLRRPGKGAVTAEPAAFALHAITEESAVTHFVPVGGHPPVLEFD